MAYLRMAVREPRVCAWLVRHRERAASITMTGGGENNVTWTWNGEPVPFGMTTGTNATTATLVYSPTLEEIRKVIGPDCRALDWVQARYRARG